MTTLGISRQLRSSTRDWPELCCLETATIPSVSPPSPPPEPETRNETLRMQRWLDQVSLAFVRYMTVLRLVEMVCSVEAEAKEVR
jgi:hypothetical protein